MMAMANQVDTIYALSTPVGGALSIIRISGSKTLCLINSIFDGVIAHRRCSYGALRDNNGNLIDSCTATYFKAPHSYTGEDMAELCVHGSYAVVKAVFGLLSSHSLRQASAGEFTRRAFMNGKLDLAQADAVMDIISSATELSRQAAAYQLEGGLSKRINELYYRLSDTASYINAIIDFPDEMEDYSVGVGTVMNSIKSVFDDICALIENGNNSRILRDGARIAIVGKPNVGKSSLLNALVSRERAIVADLPGTTRDTIEETSQVCGIPVVFIDTAGVHNTADVVERMGVARSIREAENANLVLAVFDGSAPLNGDDHALLLRISGLPVVTVIAKADLQQKTTPDSIIGLMGDTPIVSVSSVSGDGLDTLRSVIASRLMPLGDESVVVTNSRHIESLCLAKAALADATSAGELDCIATDLRNAMLYLGRITGRSADEDMLDSIFSRFCVGK